MGRKTGEDKAELIGWNKNCSLGQKRKIARWLWLFMYIHAHTKHVTHSAVAHYTPTGPQQQQTPLPFHLPAPLVLVALFFTWSHTVWNIPLARLGELSWFCSLPAPRPSSLLAGRAVWEADKLKHPWLCTVLLSKNWNISVLSTLFFSLRQSTASHHTLWGHCVPPETRFQVCVTGDWSVFSDRFLKTKTLNYYVLSSFMN